MPAASAVAVTQVVMDSSATTTIISNINSLYGNIFTFVAVLVTLGGVVFPIALTRYQNIKLRNNQKQLIDFITTEIALAKAKLIEELKAELALDIAKIEKNMADVKVELNQRISKTSAGLNAKSHHTQGNTNKAKNMHGSALLDYLVAASDYVKAGDERNLRVVIRLIITTLAKVTKVDFEAEEDIDITFNAFIKQIAALNQGGGYSEDIQTMKSKLKEAKVRVDSE